MSFAEPTMARATAMMSSLTAASRATGFLRVAAMAYAIGGVESKVADTYTLANSTPNIIYQLVVGEVLATLLVPVFVESFRKRGGAASWRLAGTIMNLALIGASVATALTVILAPQIMSLYALNLDGPDAALQRETGAFFLRILMPQMIFYAVGMVFTGLLNAHRRFGPPMFAPLLNNVIVIATFVTFRAVHGPGIPTLQTMTDGEKLLLAGGTTLGVVAMTLCLWPFVHRIPGKLSMRALEWRDPEIRAVAKLSTWSLAYVAANQVGLWAINVLANGSDGGVAAYQTSWILYQLPYALFAASVFTFLAPRMAGHVVDGDLANVRRDVSLGTRLSALVVLPAVAGFVALGRPLIELLLERGVFSARSTELFADTFVLMALGLGAFTFFQLSMRAFYAMKDTRTPFVVNVIVETALIGSAIPLYASIGVAGLGLAHSISYAVGAIAGMWWLRSRLGGLDGARLASSLSRIALASALAGGAAFGVRAALEDASAWLTVTLGGVALVAVFLASAVALRVSELTEVLELMRARLTRRSTPEQR
jgi:putative peptidoglycan lipid II flippase